MFATAIPTVLNTVHDVNEMETEKQWRDEDNYRRKWDNIRRLIDEKKHQLEALANLSAVFAGCSMICIVELDVPACTNSALVVYFNLMSSVAVCLTVLALCNSLILYVVVGKFDISESIGGAKSKSKSVQFSRYWRELADGLWEQSLKFFIFGVISFLMALTVLGWVKYWQRLPRTWSNCETEKEKEGSEDPTDYGDNAALGWLIAVGNVINSLVFLASISYFVLRLHSYYQILVVDKTPDNDPLENKSDYIPRGFQNYFAQTPENDERKTS